MNLTPEEIRFLYLIYQEYESYSQFAADWLIGVEQELQFLNVISEAKAAVTESGQTLAYLGQLVAQEPIPEYLSNSGSASDAYEAAKQAGTQLVGGGGAVWTTVATAVKTALGYIPAGIIYVGAGAVAAGAGALCGYSIYKKVDENDPDFWEGLIGSFLPWTLDYINEKYGVCIDYNGKTYVDTRIYLAVKYYLESTLIPGFIIDDAYENQVLKSLMEENRLVEFKFNEGTNTASNVTVDNITFSVSTMNVEFGGASGSVTNPYIRASGLYRTTGMFFYRVNGKQYALAASEYKSFNEPINLDTRRGYCYHFLTYKYYSNKENYDNDNPSRTQTSIFYDSLYESYSRDNKRVSFSIVINGEPLDNGYEGLGPVFDRALNLAERNEIAWNMVYGNTSTTEGAEGVSRWTGNQVEDPYDGAIDVVTDENGNTTQYIPFSLPGNDEDLLNPTTNPNPQQYTQPQNQVQPYGQDSPFPTAVPNPDSNSDPSVNPSTQPSVPVDFIAPAVPSYSDSGTTPVNPPNTTPPAFLPGSSSPSGLINVYNPMPAQLYSFANWLWVAYRDFSLAKVLNNPFDGVISLHEIYATPYRGAIQEIRSGFLDSGEHAFTVPQRYTQINCGSLVVPEYYGNYFDYAPYTKVYVYLPFIGVEELDPEDIIGAGVNITYGVDSYSGACVAMITTAKEGYNAVTYQFTGNCSVQHPLTGGTQMQTLLAMGQGVLNVVMDVADITTSKGIGGVIGGVSSALSDVVGIGKVKSSVYHSGSLTGNFGAMAIKKPYLIVKRPKQVVVPNYNDFYGYPAHKYVVIGQCSGFVRCREVHVNSARATDEEKQEIESLLKAGVYVS